MTIIAWNYAIIYDIRNASGLPSLKTRRGFTSMDRPREKSRKRFRHRPLINDQPRDRTRIGPPASHTMGIIQEQPHG